MTCCQVAKSASSQAAEVAVPARRHGPPRRSRRTARRPARPGPRTAPRRVMSVGPVGGARALGVDLRGATWRGSPPCAPRARRARRRARTAAATWWPSPAPTPETTTVFPCKERRRHGAPPGSGSFADGASEYGRPPEEGRGEAREHEAMSEGTPASERLRRAGRRRPLRRAPRARADHHGRAASGPRVRVQPLVRGRPLLAGAMAMPWMFAGRRWVATRELQLLRAPEESAVARPVTAGLLPLHVLGHRGPLRRPHEVDRRHQQAPQPRRPRPPGPHPRLHGLPGPRGDRLPGRRGRPARLPRAGPPVRGLVLEVIDAERARAARGAAGVAAGPAPAAAARGFPGGDGDGLPADPAAGRPDDVREAGRGRRHPADAAVVPAGGPAGVLGGALRRARGRRWRSPAWGGWSWWRRSSRPSRAPTATSTSCAEYPGEGCGGRARRVGGGHGRAPSAGTAGQSRGLMR